MFGFKKQNNFGVRTVYVSMYLVLVAYKLQNQQIKFKLMNRDQLKSN